MEEKQLSQLEQEVSLSPEKKQIGEGHENILLQIQLPEHEKMIPSIPLSPKISSNLLEEKSEPILVGQTNLAEKNEKEKHEEPVKGKEKKGKRGKPKGEAKPKGKSSEPKIKRGRKPKSSNETIERPRSSSPKVKKAHKKTSVSERHPLTRDKKKISNEEYDKYSHFLDKKTKRKKGK